MKRAHASRGANRKFFMIRTSLRISLRTRNRTFVNVIAARRASAPLLRREKRTIARLNLRNVNGANRKIFIDRLLWRRLKVESSGVQWAIAPRDNGGRFPTRTLLRRRVPAFH